MAKAETHSPTQVARVPAYLSINPGLLDSVDHWSYRDLQKLAKRLQLSSTGKRESVVNRLKEWHREQRECGQAGHFHSVEVRASVEGKPISPRLLSPLVSPRKPTKTILSSGGASPSQSPSRSPLQSNGRSNVLFSPYNMVKLIPSKEHSEMFGQYREPANQFFEDDDDEDAINGGWP